MTREGIRFVGPAQRAAMPDQGGRWTQIAKEGATR